VVVGGGRRLNGLLYIYVHAGDVLNEYSINDKKLKMNIHKVNMKYICIFKNSTVHLYNNERCLKKIKKLEENRSETVDRNGRF
jgi:hypothetical protein